MLVGKKYRGEQIERDYDVVVIGSGTGGLSLACILSQKGRKVLVLEQHYTAGGMTHTYKRKGFEWDVGVHYIGDVHRPTSPLRLLFDRVTEGKVRWNYLGERYDTFFFPDATYDIYAGQDAFRETLLDAFPDERQAFDHYMKLVDKVCSSSDAYFASKLQSISEESQEKFPKAIERFAQYASRTAQDVLSSLNASTRFMGVLTAQWPDFGLSPAKASFAMQAMCTRHYLNGAAYPVGGPAAISRALTEVITSRGGLVLCNAGVSEILLSSSGARGVKLHDGTEIPSKTVVCAGGIHTTFLNLLPTDCTVRKHYQKVIGHLLPSFSHLCLYVGLRGTPAELNLPMCNYWLYPGYDHDDNVAAFHKNPYQAEQPFSFVSFPAAKDPTWTTRFPERSTAQVMSYTSYDLFKKWQHTEWNNRGAEYQDYKGKLQEKLLRQLYSVAPQLEGAVEYSELSTPLSTNHFVRSSQGEIYGIEHSPERFLNYWLRPETLVPGVYLTGQDVSTNGVGGALFGGWLCAEAVLSE